MSESIEYVTKLIDRRIAMADEDPESGHYLIDELCESVVRSVANGEDGAQEAAVLVSNLLDRESREHWYRWYS